MDRCSGMENARDVPWQPLKLHLSLLSRIIVTDGLQTISTNLTRVRLRYSDRISISILFGPVLCPQPGEVVRMHARMFKLIAPAIDALKRYTCLVRLSSGVNNTIAVVGMMRLRPTLRIFWSACAASCDPCSMPSVTSNWLPC